VETLVEGEAQALVTLEGNLRFSYPMRQATVVELTIVTDSVTLLAYPLIEVVDDPGIRNLLPGSSISIVDSTSPANVYSSTVLSAYYDAAGDNNWIGLDELAPVVCEPVCQLSNLPAGSTVTADSPRTEDSVQVNVSDTSGNTSADTNKDGVAGADFDELELWTGGNVK
jgi:hypothetical protein